MTTKSAHRALAAVLAAAAFGAAAPGAQAATNVIDTIAGVASLPASDGPAFQRSFIIPTDVEGMADGSVLVADRDNWRVRKVANGQITTVAGGGGDLYSNDIPATQAYLWRPSDVEPTPDGGFLVVEPEMNRVRKVGPDGRIRTVAGNGSLEVNTGNGGPATQAGLYYPWAVAMHPDGGFVVSQPLGYRVRRVKPDGTIHLVFGDGTQDWADDQPAVEAGANFPYGVDVDADGRIYVAEDYGAKVRVIGLDGIVRRFAGTGYAGHSGDEGPALDAHTGRLADLAIAPDGSVVFSQTQYWHIRRVTPDGKIHTIVGTGEGGYTGDGGLATASPMGQPGGVGFTPDGDLLLTDGSYSRIRKVDTDYVPSTEEPGGGEEEPGGGEEEPGGGTEQPGGGTTKPDPSGAGDTPSGTSSPAGTTPSGSTATPDTIATIAERGREAGRGAPAAISSAKGSVRVRRGRRAKVTLTTATAGTLAIEVRRGTKRVAKASRAVAAGKVTVTLPAIARRGRYVVRLVLKAGDQKAETSLRLTVS